MALTQAHKFVAVSTPLGEDVLVVRNFACTEQISRLFHIELDLISTDGSVKFEDVIGQAATVRMEVAKDQTRYFNGVISRFVQTKNDGNFAHYRATIVPWLWLLTRTSDCRIFQEKTVPDIIEEVFKGHGLDQYKLSLSASYRNWQYCVQYRETDFNFVGRLMEQEGIYYYFEHENGKHTLVLADSYSAHSPYQSYETMVYRPPSDTRPLDRECITDWVVEKELQPGAYALNDFDFEKPKKNLRTVQTIQREHAVANLEVYDFPGEYVEHADGEAYAKVRIEELQAGYEVCHASSNARGIVPGCLFTLQDHPREDQNREYLITSVTYQVDLGGFESGADSGESEYCTCSFTAIDSQTPFRPPRITPKPVIQGPQTAIVVGPAGDEIHTDKHARVKVQFHWDRYGKFDENSSCWVRVSHPWAGKGWGSMATPRIGQEVIIEFLEGDPDEPIITGRVYNGECPPPYAGGQGVVSGLKSCTHKGSGYNEISMDDTAGKEKITIHAQYDMNTVIEHDETIQIKTGNRKLNIDAGTNTETIKGTASLTVEAGSRIVKVTGGDYSAESTDGAVKLLGNGKGVDIKGNAQGVTVKGCGGPGVKITGEPNFEAKGASQAKISSPDVDIGDGTIKIHGSKIELIAGGSSVKIDSSGVTIKGAMVKINV